jgi:tRNA (cmo5U34)-methyltransferase
MLDWSFDNEHLAGIFEYHVRGQLPWYDLVTDAVGHLSRHYIRTGGRVYDIGASTGNIGRKLERTLTNRHCEFVAIECSEEMAKKYDGPQRLVIGDATKYPYGNFDLAVCFLTLMFVDIKKRKSFVSKLYRQCNPGGAIIVVDKEVGVGGYMQTALSRLTMAMKKPDYLSTTEKELSLAGIQRPIERNVLPNHAVEFFRFGEFAGYVIEKPECYGS